VLCPRKHLLPAQFIEVAMEQQALQRLQVLTNQLALVRIVPTPGQCGVSSEDADLGLCHLLLQDNGAPGLMRQVFNLSYTLTYLPLLH
jgi:hypothetical protein